MSCRLLFSRYCAVFFLLTHLFLKGPICCKRYHEKSTTESKKQITATSRQWCQKRKYRYEYITLMPMNRILFVSVWVYFTYKDDNTTCSWRKQDIKGEHIYFLKIGFPDHTSHFRQHLSQRNVILTSKASKLTKCLPQDLIVAVDPKGTSFARCLFICSSISNFFAQKDNNSKKMFREKCDIFLGEEPQTHLQLEHLSLLHSCIPNTIFTILKKQQQYSRYYVTDKVHTYIIIFISVTNPQM